MHIQTPVTGGCGDAARMRGVEERGLAREELRGDGLLTPFVLTDGCRYNVIFGEDFRNPACARSVTTPLMERGLSKTYIGFNPIHLLQFYSYGVPARIIVIDIAGAVRGEVCEAILIVCDLVFPCEISSSASDWGEQ